MNVVGEAIRAVPAVRFALGLAGIVALVGVAASFVRGLPLISLLPIVVIAIVAMGLLMILSAADAVPQEQKQKIALVFLWAICLLTIASMGLGLSSIAFDWPLHLREKIVPLPLGPISSPAPVAPVVIHKEPSPLIPRPEPVKPKPVLIPAPPKIVGTVVSIHDALDDTQRREHIRLLINDVERAVFTLNGKHKEQEVPVNVKLGDRYSIIGEQERNDTNGKFYPELLRGNGTFKSPLARKYHFRQTASSNTTQHIAIVKDDAPPS